MKEHISNLAFQIGDYLSSQVEPKNEQERILADLWSVADKEEQQAIANMMVKLISKIMGPVKREEASPLFFYVINPIHY